MNRKLAVRLMNDLSAHAEPLNSAAETIERIGDIEERKKIRKATTEIMGRIITDIEMPVLQQYPDLDPDIKKI